MILSWIFHSVYATSIAYVLAHLFGGIGPLTAAVSLLLGALMGRRHAGYFAESHPDWRFGAFSKGRSMTLEISLFAIVLYAGVRHFVWLFFRVDHSWSTLAINNFGDLPLHVNYIRAFAQGVPFPPPNPSYATELLRYPLGSDLYNALWETLGVRMSAHLAVVGILALVASLIFLRSFGGWWAVGAFFLSGGIMGWQIFQGAQITNFHQAVEWKNLFLAVFVTQRGMLWALPVGLMLLVSVSQHFSGKTRLDKKQMTALGLLWAALPLFHLHAFVVVSVMMAGIAFAYGGVPGVKGLLLSRMAFIAYLPATYLILFSTDFLRKSGVVHLNWGWSAPEGELAAFLFVNFGPWLLLPLSIAAGLWKLKRKDLWVEFAVYSVLLVTFFNVMLAPWSWDNIKVLLWPYLGFARLGWLVLDPWLDRFGGVLARAIVAMTLFFSGFSVLSWSLQDHQARITGLYRTIDLASTQGALDGIPVDAVFVAHGSHNHPLTYFGRLRVLGYEGHLWSHGIKSAAVTAKVQDVIEGRGNWLETAASLGITHIFWGPEEKLIYGPRRRPWMDVLENVSRVPDYEIFAIKK
jgi:hypothetical protein